MAKKVSVKKVGVKGINGRLRKITARIKKLREKRAELMKKKRELKVGKVAQGV